MSTEEFYEAYIKKELNDYLNRYFVKVCGEYLALLNASGTVGSTGSENGRMDRKKGTIDIIAQMDSVRQNIVAICNWSEPELTDEMWKNFEFSDETGKIKADSIICFLHSPLMKQSRTGRRKSENKIN